MIRPLGDADAGAIAAFFAAAHRHDPAVGAVSEADWRRFMASAQNRGGRDFRVALEDGAIAGVATPSLRDRDTPWLRHFRIVVAPERRRRGIGSRLLRQVAEMDAPRPVVLQTLCPGRWTAAAQFLAASGFAVLEHELDMACDPGTAGEPVAAGPAAIRSLADCAPLAAALAALHNRAYAGAASFVRLSGGEMAELFDDRAFVLVAEIEGSPVGYCHVELGRGESWLESVAVDPDRHGRGIGAALVARALAEARRRGGARVRLAVADRNATALRLYRRLGFQVVAQSARYRAERDQVLAALGGKGR
jgi:mycothiol synthase